MSHAVLTVPCFNEASRFAADRFAALSDELSLLFVDDGSTDGTGDLLDRFCQEVGPERAQTLRLPANVGKGEAVRQGLLESLSIGAPVVGYADADLATPPSELIRLAAELSNQDDQGGDRGNQATVVIGSRIAHLGANVERGPLRHYLGRMFATAASFVLQAQIYDTQCGAKFFRTTDGFARAIDVPFVSRWSFDVELLGRLLHEGETVVEVPLREWRDVAGSKLRVTSMAKAGLELASISRALGRYAKR